MKKKFGFFVFIGIQVMLIVCHIHQQSIFVGELYRKQRIDTVEQTLRHKKQLLEKQVCACKRPDEIKKFAVQELSMSPVGLSQIKTMAPV